MTLAPLREAADSLAKASTPEPWSTSRTSNWIARGGGLPAYIQHVSHDIHEKRGVPESQAIQIAIGVIKRWARGGGNVDAGTRAAAAKALAEWEALRAKAHAKSAVQHSDYAPTMADELALREAALQRVAVLSGGFGGPDGLVRLLEFGGGLVEAAAGWSPTLKRTASADSELERHDVSDNGQTVGMISKRKSYAMGSARPQQWRAHAVNGMPVGDSCGSQAEALGTLRKHLEDAPARVITSPPAGKFLVATPSSYGATGYREFPNEGAARHAAGLPAQPTLPEKSAKVDALGEMLRMDLQTLSGQDIPPLARVQEARARVPFDLAEAFNPGEPRGFGGKWVRGLARAFDPGHPPKSPARVSRSSGVTVRPGPRVRGQLTPRSVVPGSARPRAKRPKADAQRRYEGGVRRASASARSRLAAMKPVEEKQLPRSVGRGVWDAAARRAIADMRAGRTNVKDKEGSRFETEAAHTLKDKSGKPIRDAKGGLVYSKERRELHARIISLLLQGHREQAHPEVHFTAGGPASGKSELVRSGKMALPSDVVHVDPDIIKEMLPEYAALKGGYQGAATSVHEESSHIAKLATKIAMGRQHHVLVDSVGDSEPGKFSKKLRDAQAAGYGVHVHYATSSVKMALAHAEERRKRTGRAVPESYLRQAHRDVSRIFAREVVKMPGIHLRVSDTSLKGHPKLIAEKPAGDKLVIKDRFNYKRFLDKGKG